MKQYLYSTVIEDRVDILMRELIGVEAQRWSSDYPHSCSSWPNSMKLLDEHFAGVPAAERFRMVCRKRNAPLQTELTLLTRKVTRSMKLHSFAFVRERRIQGSMVQEASFGVKRCTLRLARR